MNRRQLSHLAIWHCLVLALLLMLPGIKFGYPIWIVGGSEWQATLVLIGAYIVIAAMLTTARALGKSLGLLDASLIALAVYAVAFLAILLSGAHPPVSRAIVLLLFSAALLASLATLTLRVITWSALGVLALVVCTAFGVTLYQKLGPKQFHKTQLSSFKETAFYTLHIVTYRNYIPPTYVRGGSISLVGDQYLLVTGDGRLYLFKWDATNTSDALRVRALPYHVPINAEEFARAVGSKWDYQAEANTGAADDKMGVQTWQFRVADAIVQPVGDKIRLFVSHHYWKSSAHCFVVRVSVMEGSRDAFLAGGADLKWQTLFESTPCLPLQGPNAIRGNNPFWGMEVGGRMRMLDNQTLMLTLGDHGFDGVESPLMLAQDPAASYGKTLLIHLGDRGSEIYSMGHRNPQGLYIDPTGSIWLTEHGPQGGDELNLIERNANYGWPLVTYGTDYGSDNWPLNRNQGRHEGYTRPVYAWVPSIGVSNLVGIEKDRFPIWKGDLMVASLHANTLWRTRLEDGRVIYTEPIQIEGQRIRDIIEGDDGRLVLWTDSSDLISLLPAEGKSGAVLFATRCGACHVAANGASHAYGPDLANIVGRKAASATGFESYSPALKSLRFTWTEAQLDRFLTNPQAMAPGTTMTLQGIGDKTERTAIIQYLKSLH